MNKYEITAGLNYLKESTLNEFNPYNEKGERWEDDPEPDKYDASNAKLVTKDGQEVKLPYETVDFRGDPMTVIGFTPPHKSSSSGRIEVEGGMTEYFPGVAGLKIIGHEFDDMNESTEDDDLRDEESGKNHDPETGKRTKPHPFNPDDDSIDEHRGPRNPRFSDKEIKMAYGIANDPRYKDGNMSGAIKAIESIKKGLSDHPSVEKVLQATQMEETKSGGQTFAGHFKTGPAGQWKNTGKTKGRPAKVGDLVGAESIGDDTYSTGDTVTLRNGSEWTLEVDMNDGTIWATDEDGHEVELDEIVGQIVDHGKPEDRKDHSPDNMSDDDVEIFVEMALNEFDWKSKVSKPIGAAVGGTAGSALGGIGGMVAGGLAGAAGGDYIHDVLADAFKGDWARMNPLQRKKVAAKIRAAKNKHLEEDEALAEMQKMAGLEEAGKPTTNSKHSSERDLKKYDPTHGHTKPEGGNPDVCKECHGAGCTQCDDGQVITPKRHDKKVDEAENSPDGNVGADDDGDNDKYNQQQTVNDRKSIQEADELLDIIKNIRI